MKQKNLKVLNFILAVSFLFLYQYGFSQTDPHVIDFEPNPNANYDYSGNEPFAFDNAFFEENYCITFHQGSLNGITPTVAQVGPVIDQQNNHICHGFLLDSGPETSDECGGPSSKCDMPVDENQNIGCYFLRTDRVDNQPMDLYVNYSPTCGCSQASGDLIDIDGNERWRIEAYAVGNQSNLPDQTIFLCSPAQTQQNNNCFNISNEAGDGKATRWEIDLGNDQIDYILFTYAGSGNPGFSFDNFSACSIQNDDPCGTVIEDTLSQACTIQGNYEYTFNLENNTNYTVTSATLMNITPANTTIQAVMPNGNTTSPFWKLNNSAPFFLPEMQPNGGTTGPLKILITPGSPITQPTVICFDVVYYSNTFECCRFQHCITLEPIDPCSSVAVFAEPAEEDCCYTLELVNDYCPNYFTGVITELVTDGVIFTNVDGGNTWSPQSFNDDKSIYWLPNTGTIPMGITNEMTFCFGNIFNVNQVPQVVLFHWLAIDPNTGEEIIVCTEELVFECELCLFLDIGEIICNPDGSYTVNFSVFNNWVLDATYLILEVNTPNILIDPAIQMINLPINNTYHGSFTVTDFNPLPPGSKISFKAILDDGEGECCHVDGFTFTVPDCGQGGGCDCGLEEDFINSVLDGFTLTESCLTDEFVLMPNALTECDRIRWAIFDEAGNIVDMEAGSGNTPVTFPIPGNGVFTVHMIVTRDDDNGLVCFETQTFIDDIVIDCGNLPDGSEFGLAKPNTGIHLYPNPTTDYLVINPKEKGQYRIRILNHDGRVVKNWEGFVDTQQKIRLEISELVPGLFYVQLEYQDGSLEEDKFIKM